MKTPLEKLVDLCRDLAKRVRRLEAQDYLAGGVGVDTFIGLTDTPASYTGEAGKFAAVNGTETALEFVVSPVGVNQFTDLTDAPASFAGAASKLVAVDSGETALEFITPVTVGTDPIWDSAGDLVVGTGPDAAARLGIGAEGQLLGIEGGVLAWVTRSTAGTLFLHEEASDVAGYDKLLDTPADDAETNDTAVCNSGSGEVAIAEFITYPVTGLGTTLIPGGAWNFLTFGSVDSVVGVTQIVIRVFKRAVDNSETELFNLTTPEINSASAIEISFEIVRPDILITSTDRLVVKYLAKTTSVPNRTVTLYYEGTANYSHIHTPFQLEAVAPGALALDDLTDVNAPSPTDGQVVTWDDGAGEWIAASPVGGSSGGVLGYASDETLRTYTANNTWETVSGTTVNFSLSAEADCIVSISIEIKAASSNWEHFAFRLILDGSESGYEPSVWLQYRDNDADQSRIILLSFHFILVNLSAGDHTVALRTGDNGSSLDRSFYRSLITVM